MRRTSNRRTRFAGSSSGSREEEKQMLSDIDETKQRWRSPPSRRNWPTSASNSRRRGLKRSKPRSRWRKAPLRRRCQRHPRPADLQQLRDDFRKKDQRPVQRGDAEMRSDARELAQNQEELARKLEPQPAKQERPTLDGSGEREQLADKFTKQQGDLNKLTEKMKDVSEQAEAAEPLLAKELYDTLRKTTQAGDRQNLGKDAGTRPAWLCGRRPPVRAKGPERNRRLEDRRGARPRKACSATKRMRCAPHGRKSMR